MIWSDLLLNRQPSIEREYIVYIVSSETLYILDMEDSIGPLGSLHFSYHLDLPGLIDGNSLYLFSHHKKFHDTELELYNSIDTSWMIFIFSPQSILHPVLPTIRSQPLEAFNGGMVPLKPPNTQLNSYTE